MTLLRQLLAVASIFAAACSGDTGPAGPAGGDGSNGSDGSAGPITDPPALSGLSPTWGSANTHVTITGTGFSTTATDDHVFFDGHAATVLTATATSLVVRPDVATDSTQPAVVDVEVANQVSNALVFELVASGSAAPVDVPLPNAPTGVVAVGTDLYIASGVNGQSRTGGLFKLSAGVVTQVVAGHRITVSSPGGPVELIDGPVALATSGGDVFYTTTFGSVRKYAVANGDVTEVLAPGNGGNVFPGRTGLVFDAGGDLYVVDRNLSGGAIVRLRANGTAGVIADAAFLGSGGNGGIFGIASDGTDLFVTNEFYGRVSKVASLATTPTVSLVATAPVTLQGVAVLGATVVASGDDTILYQAAKTASAVTATAFRDPAGYLYEASGLAVSGTDLLLAQPGGADVRRLPTATNTSSIVAAGVRVALATVQVGDSWYVSTVGQALFGGGPSVTQPDGAILEITPAGTSRLLANPVLPVGIVPSGAGELTVADCVGARIYKLAIATAAQTDVLTTSDGLTCPTGLALDANNYLYYVDAPNGNPARIGKLAAGVHTASYGTGLASGSIALAIAGGQLVTTALNPGGNQPLQKVSLASGGAATVLTSGPVIGGASVTTAPDGTLFALRSVGGDVLTVDPATGTLSPFGSANPPGTTLGGGGGPGSIAFSFATGADGTLTLMDFGRGGLVSIAP